MGLPTTENEEDTEAGGPFERVGTRLPVEHGLCWPAVSPTRLVLVTFIGIATAAWLAFSLKEQTSFSLSERTSFFWARELLRCSAAGQDCSSSKCCLDPDRLCFQKNATYAECKHSCVVGVHEDDLPGPRMPWTCRILRPLKDWQPQPVHDASSAPPAAATSRTECSDAAEDCSRTGCCKNSSMKCFQKNVRWSGCLVSCERGIHTRDPVEEQTPWTCGPPHLKGPSLFCFAICRSSGSDLALMRHQALISAGVFGCNAYSVFSDAELDLPNVHVIPQVVAQKGVAGALTATWVNANAFIAAWDHIMSQTMFLNHDWVVKADPDCVFVPSRLRDHLAQPQFSSAGSAPLGAYLKNCAAGPRGLQLFGSIEVLSKNAVQTLMTNWDRCKAKVDHSLCGEDMWLQKSLDLLHVQPVEDYGVLVLDGYCPGLPAPDICTPSFMAFHPKKVPEQWLKCWEETLK